MNTDNRQLLRKQLEQQAKLFTTNQDNTKLIISVLSTCSALLRAVENSMPKSLSQSEFESIFAGYLGVINRVNSFYKKNTAYFNADESKTLQTILTSLEQAAEEKREFDEKLAGEQKKYNATKAAVEKVKQALEAETEKHNKLIADEKNLKQKLQNIKGRIATLEKELERTDSDIENLESNIEKLIQEVHTAKETYEEMTAYYSELERIQAGIKEEGYVNMDSFLEKVQSMNNSGTELMAQYDHLLKKLTNDIESLQAKIEKRRKAG